jgi:hypothetical protein
MQDKSGKPSRVQAYRNADKSEYTIRTQNVSWLTIPLRAPNVTFNIDGQQLVVDGSPAPGKIIDPVYDDSSSNGLFALLKKDGVWTSSGWSKSWRVEAPGNLKNIFDRDFFFVVGTKGSKAENAWAMNGARYLAETFMYRGNGAVDVVTDEDYMHQVHQEEQAKEHSNTFVLEAPLSTPRNAVLFGNADTNLAWATLMGGCPVQIREGFARAGGKRFNGKKVGGLVSYLQGYRQFSVAVTGTGLQGMQATNRLGLFSSGIAYPDWILTEPDAPAGILADGFYDSEWKLDPANSAFAAGK